MFNFGVERKHINYFYSLKVNFYEE